MLFRSLDPALVSEQLRKFLVLCPISWATVTTCAAPSTAQLRLEDAVISALDLYRVDIEFEGHDAARTAWTGQGGSSDVDMLAESARRGFRNDDIEEVEALASLNWSLSAERMAA